ncbi:MAG: helix-turn-helix domain-containing protein [Bacteroidota bacterium]
MARPKSFDEATVLERARNIFWERGYEATSIKALERATGLSRSSIYEFFGSKRSLYDRTLREYQQENLQALADHFTQSVSLRQGLVDLFKYAASATAPANCHAARGCYIVNCTAELAAVDAGAFAFATENREKATTLFREILMQAQQRGELSKAADLNALANYLFISYNGL